MPDVSAYILGQAQKSFHDVSTADHPFLQMRQIARSALADAGMPPEQVDAVACVDPLSWTYADLEKKVAAAIGCNRNVKRNSELSSWACRIVVCRNNERQPNNAAVAKKDS